jgi:hypothetical protein
MCSTSVLVVRYVQYSTYTGSLFCVGCAEARDLKEIPLQGGDVFLIYSFYYYISSTLQTIPQFLHSAQLSKLGRNRIG